MPYRTQSELAGAARQALDVIVARNLTLTEAERDAVSHATIWLNSRYTITEQMIDALNRIIQRIE